jgi:hypothetical protein
MARRHAHRALGADQRLHLARGGRFSYLNADTNMAALQGYTIRLYRELEEISGQSCGLHHVGGLTLAESPSAGPAQGGARQAPLHGPGHEIVGPGGDPPPVADHQHRRRARRPLRSPRRSSRPLRHHPRLRKAARHAGRRNRAAYHGRAPRAAGERRVAGGDEQGHGGRRARGQRRRPVGARGGAHGRPRAAAAPDGTPVPGDR